MELTVQERFSEDEEVKIFIDANLLKDSQYGNGINSGNQRREDEAISWLQRV